MTSSMKYLTIPTLSFMLFTATNVIAECRSSALSVAGKEFTVRIADEPAEYSLGLMNVGYLPDNAGMLFVFPSQGHVSFWMKNTLIPLDMIFIEEGGRIEKIHHNAIPHDLTSVTSDLPVRYVLEINGGLSASLGLREGDFVSSVMSHSGCTTE